MLLDVSVPSPVDRASKRRHLAYQRLLYGRGGVQHVSEIMTIFLGRVLVVGMLGEDVRGSTFPPYTLLYVNVRTAWATIKSIYLLPNNTALYLQVNGLYALTRQEKMLLAILSELVYIRTLLESSNNVIATEAEWDIYHKLRKEALDGYEHTLHK
jgi:hypothetical protein